MPGSSRLANAAISLAAASTSYTETISTGECMYRLGTDTNPVGTPARLRWIASASVPVPRPSDSTVNGISSSLAGVVEQLEHPGVKHRSARDHRAGAQRVLGDLPELDAGLIGGERQVDDDRDVGLVGERARARPGERRLLLNDREREHVAGRAAVLRDQPRRLGGHVAADAVIERSRDHAVVPQLDRAGVDHRHVADPHELARLVAVLGADVDVQVLELGGLAALVVLHQMDRLARDHPGHGPVAGLRRTRWPTSTTVSQPPTWPKRR